MTGETVENNGEQQGAGASVLENMPSFEEHMDEAEKIKYGAEIAEEKQFAKEDLSFTVLEDGKEYSADFPGEKEVQERFKEEGYVCIDNRLGDIVDNIPSVCRTEEDFLVARHLARKLNAEMLASEDDAERNHKRDLLDSLELEYCTGLHDHDITANLRLSQDNKYRTEEGKALDRELIEQIEYGRKAYDAFLNSRKSN